MSFKSLIPAVFWGVLIFLVIGVSPDHIPDGELFRFKGVDKAIHFTLFFVFSVLLALGLHHSNIKSLSNLSLIIITLTIGILYGAATEFIQFAAIPGRHGSLFDFLANTIGTIFGILLFRYSLKHKTLFRNKQIGK